MEDAVAVAHVTVVEVFGGNLSVSHEQAGALHHCALTAANVAANRAPAGSQN